MPGAHDQTASHHYTIHYPEHSPREDDPHYRDFHHYREATKDTARCAFAVATGVGSECHGGLELHHSHVEFAMANTVDLTVLEARYPGISDPDTLGAWIESAENLTWLCEWHHRGHGGVHSAAAADYEAEQFVRGLIS